ncbi:GNAT family N-acetyltransferase [Goekera deserti]|uniref:GNAT family N-acetyltransferase n=1 Tax=Goekera deserti TaxID=2497753 RepID=UPI001F25A029|nr:GNAT family N-acetyltransferase [Goekera deserti]
MTHDPENSLYALTEGEGGPRVGLAAYQRSGDEWTFTHTEVDPAGEGKGRGGTLVRGALDDVRAQGGTVVPLCSFVRGWIDRHPEYQDLLPADRA